MSAIVGIFHPDRRTVETAHLEKMVETLAHRGPHGADIWSQDHIGLGHRMLWTTPESLEETLPASNQVEDIVITADARIDNRDQLLAALFNPVSEPETIPDSQLILAAYERWGEQCLDHLIGDFAFAIWDQRRQHLFCARDHMGVKPFHYYASDQVFAFATEIKALFCVPEVPKRLNEKRIGDYLTLMLFDRSMTFYQEIFRLPAAHYLIVNADGVHLQRYWSLDRDYELKLESDEAYTERFREIFTEAVRCRLRCAFPVASMLSGGLDSSSITCVATKIRAAEHPEQKPEKLPTFSAIFDEVPESDERDYIHTVVNQGRVEPNYFRGDQAGPLEHVDPILWHQDEPMYAYNQQLTWSIYKMAQQQGIRVVLDGFDGDVCVSHGVGYMSELARAGRWLKLIQELRGFSKHFNQDFNQLLWVYFRRFGLPPWILRFRKRVRRVLKRLGISLGKPSAPKSDSVPWQSPINEAFVQRIALQERYDALKKDRFGSADTQRREHYNDVTSGLVTSALELMDRAAASAELELRFPFWDKRLIEFCLSLPAEQKMQNGWTRMIMRRAMENILPTEIQWRGGKGNLGFSFEYIFRKYEAQRIQETFSERLDLITPYFDMEELEAAYARYQQGPEQSRDQDSKTLWQAVNLSLWLQVTQFDSVDSSS